MALIKCHECGREISDKAKSCPHCGAPQGDRFKDNILKENANKPSAKKSGEMTKENWKNLLYFLIVILVILILFYASGYKGGVPVYIIN